MAFSEDLRKFNSVFPPRFLHNRANMPRMTFDKPPFNAGLVDELERTYRALRACKPKGPVRVMHTDDFLREYSPTDEGKKMANQHDAPPTSVERRWLEAGYQVTRVKLPGTLGTASVAHDGERAVVSATYRQAVRQPEQVEQQKREFAPKMFDVGVTADEDKLDAMLDAAYEKRSAELAPRAEPFRAPSGFIIDALELDACGTLLRVVLRPA